MTYVVVVLITLTITAVLIAVGVTRAWVSKKHEVNEQTEAQTDATISHIENILEETATVDRVVEEQQTVIQNERRKAEQVLQEPTQANSAETFESLRELVERLPDP